MITVLTVGHSRHPAARFVALLRRHRVATLVDVRSQPYSRWAPHFQKNALDRDLGAHGIEYVFLGAELGGRPAGAERVGPGGQIDYARRAQASDFRTGIEKLIALAVRAATAILCAEEDPGRCHRRLLIAPALRQRGVAVVHIRGDGRLEPDDTASGPSPPLSLFD